MKLIVFVILALTGPVSTVYAANVLNLVQFRTYAIKRLEKVMSSSIHVEGLWFEDGIADFDEPEGAVDLAKIYVIFRAHNLSLGEKRLAFAVRVSDAHEEIMIVENPPARTKPLYLDVTSALNGLAVIPAKLKKTDLEKLIQELAHQYPKSKIYESDISGTLEFKADSVRHALQISDRLNQAGLQSEFVRPTYQAPFHIEKAMYLGDGHKQISVDLDSRRTAAAGFLGLDWLSKPPVRAVEANSSQARPVSQQCRDLF